MGHVVLLGDSIFDNARYVPGGPSVIEHLRRCLPTGWRASLAAVDGTVAADVAGQLARAPADATHLVVSAGGNNALDHGGLILHEAAESFAEVLSRLDEILAEFRREYRAMLHGVLGRGKPTAICTVYDAIPGLSPAERAGLGLFNEAILREAFRAGVPVIDLRLICSEPTDYSPASPIEPSVAGGGKIARAVCRVVTGYNFRNDGSRVFI
jgi:GDSL-like Lipase/Acylhydrolase family